jgi:hypothetical protein
LPVFSNILLALGDGCAIVVENQTGDSEFSVRLLLLS